MSAQELTVLGIGVAAVAYVFIRFVVKRRMSTCCGARTCPADKTSFVPPTTATTTTRDADA